MIFFILWLNMPGFGKAGISFLTCIRLSFALIVQGLAKKYRSEARMIFSANQSEGPSCTIRGKRLVLQVRNRNAEPKFLQKKRTTALSDSNLENVSTFENDNERKM